MAHPPLPRRMMFPGIRQAIGFLLLFLSVPGDAVAQTRGPGVFDLLCEVTSVTSDGAPSSSEGIRQGFRARATVRLPPPGTSPTQESDVSPNVKGAYWESDDPLLLRFRDSGARLAGGEAEESRLIVRDADAGKGSDALEGDAIDFPFQVGSTEVQRFGFELIDPDGEMFDTHDELPTAIDAFEWPERECFLQGINTQTLALVQATGTLTASAALATKGEYVVELPHGNPARLVAAIDLADLGDPADQTVVLPTGLATPFVFSAPYGFSVNALPVVRSDIRVDGPVTLRRSQATLQPFRLATVTTDGRLRLTGATVESFGSPGDGGAFRVEGRGELRLADTRLRNNSSAGNGGAVSVRDAGILQVSGSIFEANTAGGSGCDAWIDVSAGANDPVSLIGNSVFRGACEDGARVVQAAGSTALAANTFDNDAGQTSLDVSGAAMDALLNILYRPDAQATLAAPPPVAKPAALCGDSSGLSSLGYNIASDDSCALDDPTDLVGTDPLLSDPGGNGIPGPLPDSPAIDHGPAGLVEIDGAPALPCGWADINGLGRPQDGDGDGTFECDAGAVEVQGAGAIEAGHSGAFFNPQRNGEGEYIEVLEDDRMVIYTFSYNPAGNGPAWLIGIGNVVGNSLVTEQLLRPEGASWGGAFETADIDFADWGGMSVVFPACAMNQPPGQVVFSGNANAGFEPLLTVADRLTDIKGCGPGIPAIIPHTNAGLSGSFYDPGRNGEGLVIQYLPDGRVLAIMFTYSPGGKQMWMFGVAEADDKTVTMDVVYPTGFTPWGGDFDPADVALGDWGTWTLTWTDCNSLEFEYDSSVPGYGSGNRDYTRLTQLLGTQCPAF